MRDTRSRIKLCYVHRNFTAYTQPLDRAYMRAFQELDPPRGGQTLRRFLLGSRVQLRTCQPGLQHIGAPTVAALTRAHSSDRTSSIGTRWSCVSFSQKQNVFWRRENCFHEAQPRSLTRQTPRPKPPTASQRRTCWSHWQTTTAATARTRPLVSRNQRHQRLPLLQREQP